MVVVRLRTRRVNLTQTRTNKQKDATPLRAFPGTVKKNLQSKVKEVPGTGSFLDHVCTTGIHVCMINRMYVYVHVYVV